MSSLTIKKFFLGGISLPILTDVKMSGLAKVKLMVSEDSAINRQISLGCQLLRVYGLGVKINKI